jgi:hypothetical protein
MLFNVDFHGTIAGALHDRWIQLQMSLGASCADNSSIWDNYARMVFQTRDIIPLNHPLLKLLSDLKDGGHTINLWTNANYTVARDVKHILNGYNRIFDKFIFCAGRKAHTVVEGVVIDNEVPNLRCGSIGSILVPTFK